MKLTEARGGGGTGDVVAVGSRGPRETLEGRGYAVRVSGSSGQIGSSPQGASTFSGVYSGLFSLVELLTGARAGQLVMVGGQALVRTTGDPTVLKAQPT